MNKILGLAVGLIGLSGLSEKKRLSEKKSFLAKRKEPPVPTGAKKFYFDLNGNLLPHATNCVFECVAINESNAKRKFLNFMK